MAKQAVLLVNLGSPESPAVPDVRRYLREFLGDERVLDMPAPLRWLLLEGIILRTRPKRSAHAYAKIWTPEGSPLVVTSRQVREKIAAAVPVPVALAMRYGQPAIATVLARLVAEGVDDVLLFPQYPHYAMSSWETVVAKVLAEAKKLSSTLRFTIVQPFYAEAGYIDALVASARPYLEKPYDHLLFSYHGLPVSHLRKADSSRIHCMRAADCCETCSPAQATCYRAQVFHTTRAFAARAGLDPARWSVSFQSRLAGEPWLEPYTDREFERLPRAGKKNLLVITPAFTADCLETLEEIRIAGRETFLAAGGETFTHIPCLNNHPAFIDFLARHVQTWLETGRQRHPLLV
ncbi:MAG TPA: ferrochelatase [Opitutaceae bacterium]|jgi:ferrochelatase|nr:ferrochelatase [Opitutaceae bacterium]